MRDIELSTTEEDDILELCRINPTFHKFVYKLRRDYTEVFLQELKDILYGKIPRNFVINTKAGIGRQRGVFKTSFACQLALSLYPQFNIKENVGFTTYQLNEKIKKYAKDKQIFLLDEQIRDLKYASEQRLANIIDACRERQLCFILVGVQEAVMTISDYQLERLGESDDKYLPEKTVAFSLKKKMGAISQYRGYIKWDITPLEGNLRGTNQTLTPHKWKEFWKEYMIDKRKHQQKAIAQELTAFDFKDCAKKVMKSKKYEECKSAQQVKNLIYEMFPDNTNEERKMIYGEMR